jgi:transporter family protein
MTWLVWALLSALFAAAKALLAKIGVTGVDSNLATAIRTSVILVFHVGDCIGAGEAPRTVGDQSPELGVSGALGHL